MREIVDRFEFPTEKVREWAVRLYQDRGRRREDELRISECSFCDVYFDGYGAIYECRAGRNYSVATPELAEQGFITALKHELEFLSSYEPIRIGVWFTNKGIAAWRVSDHIHIVPSVMEKLLLAELNPTDEAKTLNVEETKEFVGELPRKVRMPNAFGDSGP